MAFPKPPLPPVPARMPNNQGTNFGQRPMPMMPRPMMPPPPPPGFAKRPGFNQMNPMAVNPANQQFANNVPLHGPYLNDYDFNKEMNFSDNQYINDLKTLEKFYEDNCYTPILEKRYYDYSIGWEAPTITLPLEELYARLKYYDDLLTYEQLNQDQVIEIHQNMKLIIDQIVKRDDYEFYKKFGYERLYYNDDYMQDVNESAFRNINYYQREDDIETWNNTENHVPIALTKNKWWIAQDMDYPEDEAYFVNFISNVNYPNEILLNPMFTSLNEYGSFQDLNQEKNYNNVLDKYPEQKTFYNNNDVAVKSKESVNTSKNKKKTKWYERIFKSSKNQKKEQKMDQSSNKGIQPSNFPKKENPPPPPQPGSLPPKINRTPPTTPGRGFAGNVPPPPFPQPNYQYQK